MACRKAMTSAGLIAPRSPSLVLILLVFVPRMRLLPGFLFGLHVGLLFCRRRADRWRRPDQRARCLLRSVGSSTGTRWSALAWRLIDRSARRPIHRHASRRLYGAAGRGRRALSCHYRTIHDLRGRMRCVVAAGTIDAGPVRSCRYGSRHRCRGQLPRRHIDDISHHRARVYKRVTGHYRHSAGSTPIHIGYV